MTTKEKYRLIIAGRLLDAQASIDELIDGMVDSQERDDLIKSMKPVEGNISNALLILDNIK
jgi:hypothetical protein